MRKKIICWVGVVAGAFVLKVFLLPIIAAEIAGGAEGVTQISLFLSFLVGAPCEVFGGVVLSNAITEGDIHKLGRSAMGVIFGILVLIG